LSAGEEQKGEERETEEDGVVPVKSASTPPFAYRNSLEMAVIDEHKARLEKNRHDPRHLRSI